MSFTLVFRSICVRYSQITEKREKLLNMLIYHPDLRARVFKKRCELHRCDNDSTNPAGQSGCRGGSHMHGGVGTLGTRLRTQNVYTALLTNSTNLRPLL